LIALPTSPRIPEREGGQLVLVGLVIGTAVFGFRHLARLVDGVFALLRRFGGGLGEFGAVGGGWGTPEGSLHFLPEWHCRVIWVESLRPVNLTHVSYRLYSLVLSDCLRELDRSI